MYGSSPSLRIVTAGDATSSRMEKNAWQGGKDSRRLQRISWIF